MSIECLVGIAFRDTSIFDQEEGVSTNYILQKQNILIPVDYKRSGNRNNLK